MRKAFTMIELTFVIVIIGIITAVAVPALNETRSDASIESAWITQKCVNADIARIRASGMMAWTYWDAVKFTEAGYDKPLFDKLSVKANKTDTGVKSMGDYYGRSCEDRKSTGCWVSRDGIHYEFRVAGSGKAILFTLTKTKLTKTGSTEKSYW